MKEETPTDPSQLSLLELFAGEVETQTGILSAGLLELERSPDPAAALQELMRAAHSLKGAARIVNLQTVVGIAHAMEDCFVAAQRNRVELKRPEIDVLLRSVDLLAQLARRTGADLSGWEAENAAEIRNCFSGLKAMVLEGGAGAGAAAAAAASRETAVEPGPGAPRPEAAGGVAVQPWQAQAPRHRHDHERVVRLTAESLNRLLGLAGESLVESRWLRPFTDSLQALKRQQTMLAVRIESLRQELDRENVSGQAKSQIDDLLHTLGESRQYLTNRMQELEVFDRRSAQLSHRLYLEVLRTRMRPFGDGARRFPRMVRDVARTLGKEVRLEIVGEGTQVDRDILERLEMPLGHLLRNAVDHGCETPGLRERLGKPPECIIKLEARHSAGMLIVSVSDDGRGVDLDALRRVIVQKNLARPHQTEKFTESELLEFLFLPGFTLRDTVSEISGRGVGLDVVQNMIRSVRGGIRVTNQSGRGLKIQLQLPLTLSVVRALLVEVDGEPYAIPLNQILRTLKLPVAQLESLEGRRHFQLGGHQVGVLTAHQVLDCGSPAPVEHDLSLVVLGDRSVRYGLMVDRFLGERELVVQPLDRRLGKVKTISAAALMEDGAPVLIMDVDEMIRSMEQIAAEAAPLALPVARRELPLARPKRILAVDDSFVVREFERKLLVGHGFDVDSAVNGVEAWTMLRGGQYDLVMVDLDMPRMDGVELTRMIRNDPQLRRLPTIVLSYKDGPEDRARCLEAGADYFLSKGSFHDAALLGAVTKLLAERGG